MTAAKRYEETHIVPYYETELTGKITLAMLINMLLLTSYDQADDLGVGTEYMLANNQGWVIAQYEMTINRMPVEHEHLRLVTEATSNDRYFAYRQFFVYDDAGTELVHVDSICVVMDQSARKIVTLPEDVITPYQSETVRRVPRLARPRKIDDADQTTAKEFQVRYFDLDTNHHVNNAHYFDWMLDALPAEFLSEHTVKHVAIRFENEVRYGNTITSKATAPVEQDGETTTKHQIVAGDEVYAEADVTWA